MIAVSEVQNQALLAFDSIAAGYDELFTRSMIGRAQRGAVWDALLDTFEPGAHILELNCGTGEDALFLARHDISVIACDGSEGMIRTARKRKQDEDPDAPIQFKLLPTEQLAKLHPGHLFDGVLSNFSGLNCVSNLDPVVWNLASLVTPRASCAHLPLDPILPRRNALVSPPRRLSQSLPQNPRGGSRKSKRVHGESTLPNLAPGEAVVLALVSAAFVHRDRCRGSTIVSWNR